MTNIDTFIERWTQSGASERANYVLFLTELTELLDVERPNPATGTSQNDSYRFERPVTFTHTGASSRGFIDLYRKGSFILEAKQGVEKHTKTDANQLSLLTEENAPKVDHKGHGVRGSRQWDDTMLKARGQADGYLRQPNDSVGDAERETTFLMGSLI